MRKITLLLACFICLHSIAQQKPWQIRGTDSASFCEVYGSEFEYNFQNEQKHKSSHKHLVLYVGAKADWLNEISMYLQERGWNYDEKNSGEGDNYMKFAFSPTISTTNNSTNIIMIGYLNKKDRIAKVTVTGKADDIIDLFIKYWEFSKISLNDLKKNKTIFQEFGSDKVAFSWSSLNPIITITRSDNPLIIPQL